MKVISSDAGRIQLELSWHELVILNNAMNETLEALDGPELATRVGATREEVTRLLAEVNAACGLRRG